MPPTDDYSLTEEEHQRALRRIKSELFHNKTQVTHPRAVVTGGQPGSGKSRLLENVRSKFPDENVVTINGDDLRGFHKYSKKILNTDDKRYAELTDPHSRRWTKESFDYAIENKYNTILLDFTAAFSSRILVSRGGLFQTGISQFTK